MAETEDRDISSRLSSLESEFSGFKVQVDSIARELTNLSQILRTVQTPNWATYIGFAGIILSIVFTVGGALLAGYSSNQRRLETAIVSMMEKALVLEFERGKTTTQIQELSDHTRQLDINLQREMRDVNAVTEAKLAAQDLRLQDEIARAASRNRELIQANADTISIMREYQDAGRTLHGEQNERMRALERSVYKTGQQP